MANKIQVTRHHIDNGERNNCEKCPVARAILADYGEDITYLSVEQGTIDINDLVYATPASVSQFINYFDDGQPVEPFEFELGEPINA